MTDSFPDFEVEERLLPAEVGQRSLIGVGRHRPTSWGNYFWLRYPAIRIVNFWAENLEALVSDGILSDGNVKVRVYNNWCGLIIDERIPSAEWFHNKLCFTGSRSPDLMIVRDMYATVGDPDNEIEQYESPEIYWSKRGGEYRNGVVVFRSTS